MGEADEAVRDWLLAMLRAAWEKSARARQREEQRGAALDYVIAQMKQTGARGGAAGQGCRAQGPKSADDHVFLGRTSAGLTHDGLQYMIKTYGRAAGLERLHPHVLRHCFARRLLERGVDIATVSQLLGHEDLRTTMRYVLPSQQDLDDAVRKLEEDW
jgi:integrase